MPRGLYERCARECVAGLGYPAAPFGLAARVFRGREGLIGNMLRRCLARRYSAVASSRARSRSRAASTAASGSGTSTMLWVASMRAMDSASRRSFLRRASAAAEIAGWALGFEEPRACYESGPTGFHMARELRALGLDCAVAAVSRMQRPASVPKSRCTTSPVKGLNAAAATDRAWTSRPMEVTWGMGSLLPAGAVRATARADIQSPLWQPEPAERSCAAGEVTPMALSYRLVASP